MTIYFSAEPSVVVCWRTVAARLVPPHRRERGKMEWRPLGSLTFHNLITKKEKIWTKHNIFVFARIISLHELFALLRQNRVT